MKKILVPVDGSEASKKAAEQAVLLARTFGSPVVFVTVVETMHEYTFSDYSGMVSPDYFSIQESIDKMNVERGTGMLEEVVSSLDCSGLKIEKTVLLGDAHPEIVKYAKKHRCDLIVMGHRGLNPFQRMFLGSVAKRVIEDAPCSVYVVK
jgi:nucleotide-binding universal stress UspA family protein